MGYEDCLRVQVLLKSGKKVDGNLIKNVPAQTHLLVCGGSAAFLQNQRGVLIYKGFADVVFIESDIIETITPLN